MKDELYMRRAIALAKLGEGWCHPNPLVGAVVVREDRIIGEGYHARCGGLHAERQALSMLSEPAWGATLYVTLEPCCHTGRQPPCTEAILEHGIRRVVIGSADPNPLVAGKGVRLLRSRGIQVTTDFLREECDSLNPVFFHYIRTGLPYVTMKYAMTMDGKIACSTGASQWITGEAARQRVQQLRHAAMAIMVGIGTVLADDPLLTCRLPGGRNPLRLICDSQLRLPPDSRIVKTAGEVPTAAVCSLDFWPEGDCSELPAPLRPLREGEQESLGRGEGLKRAGLRILNFPDENGRVKLPALLQWLGEEGIDSLLLEGGGALNEAAIRSGIVNRAEVFLAPKIFGGSGKTPVMGAGVDTPEEAFRMKLTGTERIGEDLLLHFAAEE